MAGITWTGEVLFTDSSDVGTTGVATLTLTPSVGITNLPALASGDSGPPPTLRNVIMNQVASGTTPPASSFSLVSAGSAGVPSVYDLVLYVNAGAQGLQGPSTTISTAPDLVGPLVDGYMLQYNASDAKWHVVPRPVGGIYPLTTFTAYTGNASSAQLGTYTIPAQPFAWTPTVLGGYAVPTGTANTHVDLQVLINSPTTGAQIAYGRGVTGANPGPCNLECVYGGPSWPTGTTITAPVIAAGVACPVFYMANQTASTTDSWSVGAAAGAIGLTLKVSPV